MTDTTSFMTAHSPNSAELAPGWAPEEIFLKAMDALKAIDLKFSQGAVSSLEHSRIREASLILAVESMANTLGTGLEKIICIDSRGELSLVAQGAGKFYVPPEERKTFGQAFASALTAAGVRTGAIEYGYGAIMDANASWCHMNHFSAQKMVNAFHASLCETSAQDQVAGVAVDRPRPGG
jgi:hypothetical protein